jgi:hypothetical protein
MGAAAVERVPIAPTSLTTREAANRARQNVSKREVCNDSPSSLRHRAARSGVVRMRASRRIGRAGGRHESTVIVCLMTDLYFIRNPLVGYIKIGISSNVPQRLKALEFSCGMSLELLRVIPNQGIAESCLHDLFAESRIKGEWFSPTAELVELATTDAPLHEFIRHGYAEMAERFYADGLTDAQRYEATFGEPLDLTSIELADDA